MAVATSWLRTRRIPPSMLATSSPRSITLWDTAERRRSSILWDALITSCPAGRSWNFSNRKLNERAEFRSPADPPRLHERRSVGGGWPAFASGPGAGPTARRAGIEASAVDVHDLSAGAVAHGLSTHARRLGRGRGARHRDRAAGLLQAGAP